MTLSLLGALVAAVGYGAATILQAVGVRRLGGLPSGATVRDRLPGARFYAAGLLLDLLGFLCSAAALRELPLFLVESAVASSVAVTAVLAVVFLRIRLQRSEIGALAAVGIGLVLLAVSAEEGRSRQVGQLTGWLLLSAAVVVTAIMLAGWYAVRDSGRSAIVLAVASGAAFGLMGVGARVLQVPDPWWGVLAAPVLWAVVAHGVLGSISYGLALDRGRTTTVAAVTFAVETVFPAFVGLVWLGDEVRSGLALVAAAGFAVTLGGCVVLAGQAEPEPSAD